MKSKLELGHYSNLTIYSMTNLYLHGTLEALPNEDKEHSQGQHRNVPTVVLDMGPFMTEGPGRYAHASMAPFVQQFFNVLHPVSLPDGRYTKEELVQQFGYKETDFNFGLKHYDIDSRSNDYAERVYIYNSAGFTVSKEAVFIVENSGRTKYVENMAVHALIDNFDFETAHNSVIDGLVQAGNDFLLKDQIDPDNIGRMVEITFDHKENVPAAEQYTASDFLSDQVAAARDSNGTLLQNALPAMIGVIHDLHVAGTIEPVESREEGVEYILSDGGTIMPSESADTHDIRAIPVFKPDGHPVEYIPEGGTIMPSEPAGTHNFRAVPLPHFKPEDHRETPGDTTVFAPLSATHTMAVPVYDSGEKEKEKERDDSGSSSSQNGYVPSVRDHDYNTLFAPYREEMTLSQRKQLMEDILAYEEKYGRPLNENELERVIAGAVHEIHEHHRDLREWIRDLPGLDEMQKAEIYHESLQWEDLHPGQTVTQETVLGFGAEVVMPALVLESPYLDREEKDGLLRELAFMEEPNLEDFAHRLEEREEAHVQRENREALEEWRRLEEEDRVAIEQWHEKCEHTHHDNQALREEYERKCEIYEERLQEEKAAHDAEEWARYQEELREWKEECEHIDQANEERIEQYNQDMHDWRERHDDHHPDPDDDPGIGY